MTSHAPAFGELVRDARRAAGLTQEMLAARAGLSARVISDLERQVGHTPRPGTMQLLLGALSLSAEERRLFEAAARAAPDRAAPSGNEATWPRSPRLHHASAPAPGSPGVPPIVGRAREQAILANHLDGEGPPLLVLAGEPGIGKTRLLQEAVAQATARGIHVVQGSLPAVGQHRVRDPVIDALRGAIRGRSPVQLRTELQACAWLVRALPELAFGPIEALPEATLTPEQEGALIAQAVMRFLANVAGPAGTLLTLDNLHHADAGALELLARLVQTAPVPPVRIVGAYRDSESARGDALAALLATLAHEQLVRHVTLSPLATHEAAKLLAVLLGHRSDLAPVRQGRVLRLTGGVPFYLVAWAQVLRRPQAEAAADDAVPWAIRQSVRARIDAASPLVRPVLEALAIVGGRAAYALLVALAARPDEQVFAAIEAACRERLIEEDGQGYRFAYEVIRLVVEADLGHARRLVLADRLATVERREPRLVHAGRMPIGTDPVYLPAVGPRTTLTEPPLDALAQRSPVVDERAYHLSVLRRHRRLPGAVDRRSPDR